MKPVKATMITHHPPIETVLSEAEICQNRAHINAWIISKYDEWRSRARHIAEWLELSWEDEAYQVFNDAVLNFAKVTEREATSSSVVFAHEDDVAVFVAKLISDKKMAIVTYLEWRMIDLKRSTKRRQKLMTAFTDMTTCEDDPEFEPGNDNSVKEAELFQKLLEDAATMRLEIDRLRPTQRTVIRSALKGQQLEEISENVGKSLDATEQDYHRGRRRLNPESQRLLDRLVKLARNNNPS